MEGNARRLPSWMVGGVAAAVGSKASDKEEEKKRKSRKESNGQVEVDAVGSAARRRTRGATLRHRSGDDDIGVRTKKKKGKHGSAKVVVGRPVSGDCTGEEEEEEDVELTVEDLVSIAEEYVKADENEKKEQLLEKERESWRALPRAHFSRNVSEASVVVSDNEQKPANPRSEQTLLSTTVSMGDPARDMLDLFLGPLLNKPANDHENTNYGGNNLDIEFESIRQSQNNVGEDIVAPVKKKGSFKDKVSSLLD